MILAFSGSREVTNRAVVADIIDRLPEDWKAAITEVVHGKCPRGVDAIVDELCRGRWPVKAFPAQWTRPDGSVDKGAGFARNKILALYADAGVAIMIEGGSPGTQNFIDHMTKLGKPLAVYTIPKNEAQGATK